MHAPELRHTTPWALHTPPGVRWLFSSPAAGWLWLVVRGYVGWQWLRAGEQKLIGSGSIGWVHSGTMHGKPVHAGDRLLGFWQHAVAPPQPGAMSQVGYGWYRDFLRLLIAQHTQGWFAHLIAWGEFLTGVALLLGAFTAVAACCGALLNFNYMLAGSASLNPVLFLGAVLLVLAWRVAGIVGLDRWLLPLLGTPWQPGRLFRPGSAGQQHRGHRLRGRHGLRDAAPAVALSLRRGRHTL